MNDNTGQESAPRRQRLTIQAPVLREHALPLLLALLMLALNLPGEAGRLAMRYQRSAIEAGEYWRLLTGHLAHGSWQHVWLNVGGLAVTALLLRGCYRPWQWLVIGLCAALCIDAGLYWLMPGLDWYVGLSGVLHGALAAGVPGLWRRHDRTSNDRTMALLLAAILLGKLGWEQWQGALPLSGDLNVIVNAHLYGALGGLAAGLILALAMKCASR